MKVKITESDDLRFICDICTAVFGKYTIHTLSDVRDIHLCEHCMYSLKNAIETYQEEYRE